MAIGIDCRKFDFIDCPNVQSIELALNQLIALGAVNLGKHAELTELGKKMALFPLDPKYSRILLTAPSFGCLEEVTKFIGKKLVDYFLIHGNPFLGTKHRCITVW